MQFGLTWRLRDTENREAEKMNYMLMFGGRDILCVGDGWLKSKRV